MYYIRLCAAVNQTEIWKTGPCARAGGSRIIALLSLFRLLPPESVPVKLKDSFSGPPIYLSIGHPSTYCKSIMATCPQPPSLDEHLASFESHPLFMSSLPNDTTDNAALSALQSLVHDGTPDGPFVPFCVPRRWRSHARGSTQKKSRKPSRNKEMNTSKESATERR
jgi:hypothetical protein